MQPDRACRKKKSPGSPKYNIPRKEPREEQPVRRCRTKKPAVSPAHRIPRKQPIIRPLSWLAKVPLNDDSNNNGYLEKEKKEKKENDNDVEMLWEEQFYPIFDDLVSDHQSWYSSKDACNATTTSGGIPREIIVIEDSDSEDEKEVIVIDDSDDDDENDN